MISNALSLAVDLIVQQPSSIVIGTVSTVVFGPIISSAVLQGAAEFVPGA